MFKTIKIPQGLDLTNPIHWVGFGFGAGFSPVAPGTVGTLLGFPLFLLIAPLGFYTQIWALSALFVAGVWICDLTGRAVHEADHSGIVWDEIVCFAMVLVFTPMTFLWWSAAFVTFRVFDIFKLWPASWIDNNMKNGLGVMADDLVAATFSIAVIVVAKHFII